MKKNKKFKVTFLREQTKGTVTKIKCMCINEKKKIFPKFVTVIKLFVFSKNGME